MKKNLFLVGLVFSLIFMVSVTVLAESKKTEMYYDGKVVAFTVEVDWNLKIFSKDVCLAVSQVQAKSLDPSDANVANLYVAAIAYKDGKYLNSISTKSWSEQHVEVILKEHADKFICSSSIYNDEYKPAASSRVELTD